MQIDDWKIVLFFLIVFAVHSIYLAIVSGIDNLKALHSASLVLLVAKLLLLSMIYRITHMQIVKTFTVFLLMIGSIYTVAYWMYYFANDVGTASMLWTVTSASFAVLTGAIVKKMYEINPHIMKRLGVSIFIIVLGSLVGLHLNSWDVANSLPTIASVISFALLYLAFSLENIYMRLFAFSYIVMVLTDIAFFNFYGSSLETNIIIDMLYFFIYSIWVLLFGGLALELLKMKEKEINVIERWKHADP